jgi:hypothetical protein
MGIALVGVVFAACITQQSRSGNDLSVSASQTVSTVDARVALQTKARPQIVTAVSALPFDFEENRGQVDERVKYFARTRNYTLFLTPTETVLASARTSLRMSFAGGNTQPQLTAEQPLPGKVNYYLGGDPTRWRTDIPTYGKVRYHHAYPGIDVVYYGRGGKVEYDFVVQPGADPNQIRMRFVGVEDAKLDEQGNVVRYVTGGEVQLLKPLIYQEVNGKRQEVKGTYALLPPSLRDAKVNTSAMENWDIGFTLAAYDNTRPLVIDPVLSYASYLGGTGSSPLDPRDPSYPSW